MCTYNGKVIYMENSLDVQDRETVLFARKGNSNDMIPAPVRSPADGS